MPPLMYVIFRFFRTGYSPKFNIQSKRFSISNSNSNACLRQLTQLMKSLYLLERQITAINRMWIAAVAGCKAKEENPVASVFSLRGGGALFTTSVSSASFSLMASPHFNGRYSFGILTTVAPLGLSRKQGWWENPRHLSERRSVFDNIWIID